MKHPIGVIGLGRLGLCLALNLERTGFNVIGIDNRKSHIESINNKSLKSEEPFVEEYLAESKNLLATTEHKKVLEGTCQVIFIVVSTPSLPSGGYDHSQIEAVLDQIKSFGAQVNKKHLVINCTTMPSFCDSIAEQMDTFNYSVSYNPEFIAQGSIILDQKNPDQVLIGSKNEEAANQIENIYSALCENKPSYCRMSLLSAEITKLATNCFLTSKISFANSIGDLALNVGAEPEKILAAIGQDSRIGNKYLKYGFGFGGPCFPRDNKALMHFGELNDYRLLMSEATDLTNKAHLEFQFKQWLKIPENETIEFDSVTYKKGTSILEESQQLALALKLANAGRKVLIHETETVIGLLEKSYGDIFSYAKKN